MYNELSSHNKAYLNSFQYHLKVEKGLSNNSVESYIRDVNDFLLFILKESEEIISQDVINYFINLQEIGILSSSIARKRSSIKAFFKFLKEEEIEIYLNFDEVPTIKYTQKLPDILTVNEMLKLLDSISTKTPLDQRNKAMLELMYASGLRVSELLSLKIDDVDVNSGIVKTMGKGKKERMVPFGKSAKRALLSYKALRKQKFLREEFLFVSRLGKPLSRIEFFRQVNR